CTVGDCSNRGNQTAVSSWRNTDGAYLTTRSQYDDAGNVIKTTDPNGNPTYFSYADSWANATCKPSRGNAAAYVTSVTNALGHISRKKYNSCAGTVASTTDPNNQATSYSYNDSLGRLTAVDSPDTGNVTSCYTDVGGATCPQTGPPYQVVTTQTINSSVSPKVTTSLTDGLGRVVQTQLNSDPDGVTSVDTTYDPLGRVQSVSNPHRTIASPTDGITQHQYDALGREIATIEPDNRPVTTNYSQFPIVTVTDEA